jgi:hypothetical protein
MNLESKLGNRKSKMVRIPPNVLARANRVFGEEDATDN